MIFLKQKAPFIELLPALTISYLPTTRYTNTSERIIITFVFLRLNIQLYINTSKFIKVNTMNNNR